LILSSLLIIAVLGTIFFHRSSTPRLKWQQIDGRWVEDAGLISVLTYGRGDMEIANDDDWRNYTLDADIRYDLLFPETHYGDVGLGVRISDASQGVDSYKGYYAGLRADDQTIVFGRADYGWQELGNQRLAAPIRMNAWYHMQIAVHGCHFVVIVTDPAGHITSLTVDDRTCKPTGGVALRSFYAQSSWTNVSLHLDQ
jgi:hypothetical protein